MRAVPKQRGTALKAFVGAGLAYLGTLVVVGIVALFAVIVLAGPHGGFLPRSFEPVILGLGWLAVLVAPVLVSRSVWRRLDRRARTGGVQAGDASRRPAAAILVAAIASASIWAVSRALAGHAEPWDADGLFYAGALAVAGLISGALRPRPLWAHYVGSVGGQLAFQVLFLPVGPLILLGGAFLLAFSTIFLAAAALASALRGSLTSRGPQRP